jgi:predicted O-methyltransferase YrrM
MSDISRKDFDEKFGKTEGVTVIGGLNNEINISVLVSLINSTKAKKILEIGVSGGGTAQSILNHCKGIKSYVGIDIPYEVMPVLPHQKAEQCITPGELVKDKRFKVIVLPKGSHDDSFDWKKLGKFDLIFIDGDHSYDGVKADTELAHKLIKKGGMIAWHDYNPLDNRVAGVVKYIDEVNTGPAGNHICLVDGSVTCYLVVA